MHMGVDALPAACYALPVLVSLLTIRLFYVLWRSGQPSSKPRAGGLRCLIVLGSGEYLLPVKHLLDTVIWYMKQHLQVEEHMHEFQETTMLNNLLVAASSYANCFSLRQ